MNYKEQWTRQVHTKKTKKQIKM